MLCSFLLVDCCIAPASGPEIVVSALGSAAYGRDTAAADRETAAADQGTAVARDTAPSVPDLLAFDLDTAASGPHSIAVDLGAAASWIPKGHSVLVA